MRRMLRPIEGAMLAALLVVSPAAALAEDGEPDFEGSVEVTYRNVSVDGSSQKYDEDFDGLDSGVRLSDLSANWNRIDSGLLDFLRLEASGLGGDPYERTALRLGRRDSYDLRFTHTKQTYLYNLFDLSDDEDGSVWDSRRSLTDIDLTFHPTDTIDIFFEFQGVQRDGTSLFMKDVNTDLFRLETPLDQEVKRYSIGGKFKLGPAELLFRQTLRRYDYQFDNTTRGNSGLSVTDLATLSEYDWLQNDSGGADLTTLTVSLPLGDRVNLTATAFGTLLGQEEITSRVSLNAEGTSFRGRCSVTGAVCSPTQPCDAGVAGNVCVADPFSVTDGESTARIEADHFLLDADLSVRISEPLDFHVQVSSLDREVNGSHLKDLDGNGVPDDAEGIVNDSTPGSRTRVDYTVDSITGLFDYAPSSKFRVRFGYRTIDRNLERSGFEYGTTEYRNTDFGSDNDDTLILGLVLRPVGWFRLNADYEEGDIAQAFTAAAPMETDRLRVRASFQIQPKMRLDLGYLDYRNSNAGADFRQAGDCGAPGGDIDDGCWFSEVEGTTYSAFFWHEANPKLDYWFRWAQQDVDSMIRARLDTAPFGFAENGVSAYDNTSTEWAGHVNFSWAASWRGFLGFRANNSDGDNDLVGQTFANRRVIDQDYSDVEIGMTYTFPSRLYVGGRFKVFDYDDGNDRFDYEGEILSLVAGLSF